MDNRQIRLIVNIDWIDMWAKVSGCNWPTKCIRPKIVNKVISPKVIIFLQDWFYDFAGIENAYFWDSMVTPYCMPLSSDKMYAGVNQTSWD